MVEFRALGTLSVRGPDGHELDTLLVQPKRLALLAYLCLATPRGFHRRDTLLGLFWPESDESHARGALRKALHVLRRELGDGIILTRGEDEVGVDFEALWCDGATLGDHAAAGRLDEALALYRGDLLPGFYVAAAPEFEQWLERERSRLRAVAVRTADRLAEKLQVEGKLADAVIAARAAVSLAGTDERLLRRLLELLDRAGDRTGAIAAYDEFTREVAADAGVVPSAETQALIKRIRDRSTEHAPEAGASPASTEREASTRDPVAAIPRQHRAAASVVLTDQPDSRHVVSANRARSVNLQYRLAAMLIVGVLITGSAVAIDGRFRQSEIVETKRQITHVGDVLAGAISPDGQFVAYTVPRGDSEVVVIQDVSAGGGPDTVFELFRALTLEWSPDGTQLLVGAWQHAVVIPRAGGAARRVRVPAIRQPAVRAYWLPSGNHISMHAPMHPRVYVVALATEDTLHSIMVDRGDRHLMTAGWAPNGETLAIVTGSMTSDSSFLNVVTADGRAEILVEDNVRLSSPRWSATGDTLFYLRDDRALWRIPLRSHSHRPTGPPELVSDQLDLIGPLDIAPIITATRDGRIAYLKGNRFSNHWLIEPSSSRPLSRRLTDGTFMRWGAAVSPDGNWLAFAQETPSGPELFRTPLSGKRPEQLTHGAKVKLMSDVAWSPDGNELVFVATDSDRFHLAIARTDGGRFRLLKRTVTDKRQGHLTWAPAHRIAYQSHDRTIKVVDPVTGDVQPLVTDTSGLFSSPRYSPDGNYVAVQVRQSVAVWDIQRSLLTTVSKLDHWPRSWSPDGRYIYSQDMRSIHRLDSKLEQPADRVIELPWRNAQCSAAGVQHPNAFVCTTFEYVSDIWTIERRRAAARRKRLATVTKPRSQLRRNFRH